MTVKKISKVISIIFYIIKSNPKLIFKIPKEIYSSGFGSVFNKIKRKIEIHIIDHQLIEKHASFEEIISLFENNFIKPVLPIDKPIDIILPIYNGFEYLPSLFNSIKKNSSVPYRLIIIDDCSSDENIRQYLSDFFKENQDIDIILLFNENNLGFVKTVNKAVELIQNHFILLNSDVEVPPFWIERLMFPIFSMKNIASTTPFTNSGTICSFPNYLENNEIFLSLEVDTIDSYFQKVNFLKSYIEIPTGVGFCMGVNKDLVNKIGMFNEKFGKGYGEENDWCQRAIKKGYRNIHITNLFVYHKHGGSFDFEEKADLNRKNLSILMEMHSTYQEQVSSLIAKNELKNLRNAVALKILSSKYKTRLIFDHNLGGGATDYIKKRIQDDFLPADEVVFSIRYIQESNNYLLVIQHKELDQLVSFIITSLNEVENLIIFFNIKIIFINELVSYPDILKTLKFLIELKKKYSFNLEIPIHDYFSVCASYNLLNDKMIYCNIPEYGECSKCFEFNPLVKMNTDVNTVTEWRKVWGNLLQKADVIYCFSNSSLEIILKAYPFLKKDNVLISPHKVDYIKKIKHYDFKEGKNNLIHVGVIGSIGVHKGSLIIRDMVNLITIQKLSIKIVVIGEIDQCIKNDVIQVTGKYKKENLPHIVRDNKIDIIFISSICPETFSYTTEEAMAMDLPVAVFNIGAPAERVKEYAKGYIINKISAESVLKEINYFMNSLYSINCTKNE